MERVKNSDHVFASVGIKKGKLGLCSVLVWMVDDMQFHVLLWMFHDLLKIGSFV